MPAAAGEALVSAVALALAAGNFTLEQRRVQERDAQNTVSEVGSRLLDGAIGGEFVHINGSAGLAASFRRVPAQAIRRLGGAPVSVNTGERSSTSTSNGGQVALLPTFALSAMQLPAVGLPAAAGGVGLGEDDDFDLQASVFTNSTFDPHGGGTDSEREEGAAAAAAAAAAGGGEVQEPVRRSHVASLRLRRPSTNEDVVVANQTAGAIVAVFALVGPALNTSSYNTTVRGYAFTYFPPQLPPQD
jgi:hypothetical protein